MSSLPLSPEEHREAEQLLADLGDRRQRVQQRFEELDGVDAPGEVDRRARQDLRVDLDLLDRSIERVEARIQNREPINEAPNPAARRPPLPWRAAKVLGRRLAAAIDDRQYAESRARQRRLIPPADAEDPIFSVVVPTHNRGDRLVQTLDAYGSQISDLPFEVLVVDDGSTDATPDLLAKYRASRFRLVSIRQESAGPAAARNRALTRARGRWILFTGDDIEPRPDFLLRHWQAHQGFGDPSLAVLGLTRWPEKEPGDRLTATMRHIDGVGAQQFNYTWMKAGREYDFRHFYTSNISIPKKLLGQTDGFSTHFPDAAFEDSELAYRLSRRGLRIRHVPDAVAYHHHPYRADGFYARQARCGRMAEVLERLHPELALWTGRHVLEERRVDLLYLSPDSRRRLPALQEDLPRLRAFASEIAAELDLRDPPGTDDFLRAYFFLGTLEGLAEKVESSLWAAAAWADFLAEPSRALLPHLHESSDEAASLAALPAFCGGVKRENTYPVRKS